MKEEAGRLRLHAGAAEVSIFCAHTAWVIRSSGIAAQIFFTSSSVSGTSSSSGSSQCSIGGRVVAKLRPPGISIGWTCHGSSFTSLNVLSPYAAEWSNIHGHDGSGTVSIASAVADVGCTGTDSCQLFPGSAKPSGGGSGWIRHPVPTPNGTPLEAPNSHRAMNRRHTSGCRLLTVVIVSNCARVSIVPIPNTPLLSGL